MKFDENFIGRGNAQNLTFFRGGVWYILNSGSSIVQTINFGSASDSPAPADFDGDGRADIAAYRNGTWQPLGSRSGLTTTFFGTNADIPISSVYLP